MLDENGMELVTTDWAAPIVFTSKKHGLLGFCIDYRKLNTVTNINCYPLPCMDK